MTPAPIAQEGVPAYENIVGVRSVPVLDDWGTLSHDEFSTRVSNMPVLLKGLGSSSRAIREWDHQFFKKLWKEQVGVITEKQLKQKSHPCIIRMDMDSFISSLGGPDRVYLREWYLFRKYPQLLEQLTDEFPDYLLDDWLEVIPSGWVLAPGTRNNIYWGSHGTQTACHFDSLNACTWNTTLRGVKRWLLFSCRGFHPDLSQAASFGLMRSLGIMNADGFVTMKGIKQYLTKKPDELPVLEFYSADVPAGSTIYIPWKWAHQVHNIGESLAASRYYVSSENYRACLDLIRSRKNPFVSNMFEKLVCTPTGRNLLKNIHIRSALESRVVCGLFHLVFYLMGIGTSPNHFFVPDEKGTPDEAVGM